jgi:hypothetical protein
MVIMRAKDRFEDPTFNIPPDEGGDRSAEQGQDLPLSAVGATIQWYVARLMKIPGVRSVGEGFGRAGDPAIEVGIAHPEVAQSLPSTLDGIEVVTRVVGEVDADRQRTRR